MSKTIEEIKEEVAISFGYDDYEELLDSAEDIDDIVSQVAKRYGNSETQELKEHNSELVEMLEYIFYKTNFKNHFPTTSIKVKNLLTKYTHLNKKP